ncbi:hypothetical protein [Amycolatopsis sp. NPDC051903]|uniref:hypothetical protein n=1 Tax=Amycolatopsis sp. NPDC051903 TaxID=3363936 RepID=UPI0037A05FA8
MDEKEKARIEEEARHDVAERGRRSAAISRYLRASERRAIEEHGEDVGAGAGTRAPSVTGEADPVPVRRGGDRVERRAQSVRL